MPTSHSDAATKHRKGRKRRIEPLVFMAREFVMVVYNWHEQLLPTLRGNTALATVKTDRLWPKRFAERDGGKGHAEH